jgi:uncharacterized protein
MNTPANPPSPLAPGLRQILLVLAREAIHQGLDRGRPPEVDPLAYPEALRVVRACFVTLQQHGQLRGCIGHLEGFQSLLQDVAENAFAAAFRDPRFPPLRRTELAGLEIHISILGPAEPLRFTSERDLLRQLRPGIDGLILRDGLSRGTFLPSVWESLPDPVSFLNQLKRKAGLAPDHWSPTLEVLRYETESFP